MHKLSKPPIERLIASALISYIGLSLLLDKGDQPIVATIPFFPIQGQAGVNAYIGNRPFQAIFDTGADICTLNEESAQAIGITRFPRLVKKEPYKNAGSTSYTQFKTLGGYLVPLTLGPITINTEVWVTSHPSTVIPPGLFLPTADIKFHNFAMIFLDKDKDKGSSYHNDGTFLPYLIYEDEKNLARRPIFKVDVGGVLATTLLDTGATNSYISNKVAYKIHIKRFPQPIPGIYSIPVKIGPIEYVTTFKPYPGELVILSMMDFMTEGYSMTMTDSGAFFESTTTGL